MRAPIPCIQLLLDAVFIEIPLPHTGGGCVFYRSNPAGTAAVNVMRSFRVGCRKDNR